MKRIWLMALAVVAWGLPTMADLVSLDLREHGEAGSKKTLSLSAGVEAGVLQIGVLPSGSARTRRLEIGDELELRLFEDVCITLQIVEQSESPLGGRTFVARALGQSGLEAANAVVVETVDGLQVDIHDYDAAKIYTVFSNREGVIVKEIDLTAGKVLPSAPLIPELESSVGSADEVRILSAAQQSDVCIDILVAFDANAKAWADSQGGGITNFATVAVQKMNVALANNNLDENFRFRLVGVIAVDAETTNLDTALRMATDGRDGWAPIKAMREEVGADIVSVLIDTGSAYGTTGLGWSLRTTAFASFSENAYNACAVRAVAQSHTMTHECGHNLGAGHSDRQEDSPGPQLYSYSAGYYFKVGSTSYHTIMAYGSDGITDIDYKPVPFFSSPNSFHGGVAVGDSQHDNAKTLSQTYLAATQWRKQVVAESYDVSFSPESGEAFDSQLVVELAPGKSGLAIRYTTDGSEPTMASKLYSGGIRISDTTVIKAATVVNGILGQVFQATYYKKSIGMALNAPQYEWISSTDYPWEYETYTTYDGVHSIKATVEAGGEASVKTMVTGPKSMSFMYMLDGNISFTVRCDDVAIFSKAMNGYHMRFVRVDCDIPEGTHELLINLKSNYGMAIGYVDDVRFYDTVRPTISPVADSSAAYAFEGSLMVSISHASPTAQIFYTIDGSDPNGNHALVYEGPFEIDSSLKVRAIAIEPGKGVSDETTVTYSKKGGISAGEWTTDINGAIEAAAADGKLLAILSANYNGCGYSQQLDPIARGDAFTSWAKANGVYLISADTGRETDASAAYSKFSSLYSTTSLRTALNGYIYYPTFVLAKADSPNVCCGAFVVRSGRADLNGITYDGTVESLVKCMASTMGGLSLNAAPTISPDDSSVNSFPASVTISNPNGSGTVYYTVDGSVPTPANGIRYVGPISIPSSGTKLVAMVWPNSGVGVSSPASACTYMGIEDIFATGGMNWANDASLPWVKHADGWMRGGKDLAMTSGSKISTLKATVRGPGKLKFDYKAYSGGSGNLLTFKVNGQTVEAVGSGSADSYVYEVTNGESVTFEWAYTYRYYDSYDGRYVAIGNVVWMHNPEVPTGVSVSDGDYTDGVFVKWNAVSGASSYRLYRGDDADMSNRVLVKETEKSFGWDFDAEPYKSYWYVVSAVNSFGESDASDAIMGSRIAPLDVVGDLPMAFRGITYSHSLTATGGKAPYTWTINDDNAYYTIRQPNSFVAGGVAKSWKKDDSCWALSLPFTFPFFNSKYSIVCVNSNGTLTFDGVFSSYNESATTLSNRVMIAAMWDDLNTSSGDIYVSSSDESVVIRWNGSAYSNGDAVNFAVTLYKTGMIRLSYGNGNSAGGLVGISAGNGRSVMIVESRQNVDMGNIQDIVFKPVTLPPGLTLSASGLLAGICSEAGSYEFVVAVEDSSGRSLKRIFNMMVKDEPETVIVPTSVTGGKPLTISKLWPSDYPQFVSKFGVDLAAALTKKTGKKDANGDEMAVWQDYVAGTDPTDPESQFKASVEFVGGKPVIKWTPDLNEDGAKSLRVYKTFGAKSLGGLWEEVKGNEADYNFFKVTVEMP